MIKMTIHIRRNSVAYLALFVALGGSAYAAATIGSAEVIDNSLRSEDLRNGQVRSGDIRDDTVTGGGFASDIAARTITNANVAVGSLSAAEIQDKTLTGDDVQPNSLGGGQINEGTMILSDVVGSGSLAPGSLDKSCDPNGTTFISCGNPITFTAIEEEEVLAITTIQWHSDSGGAAGQCRYVRNGAAINSLTATVGEVNNTTDFSHPGSATLLGLFAPNTEGQLDVRIECRETESNIVFAEVTVAALALAA